MEQKTLDVYSSLADHNLQSFFIAFNQTLKVNQKRDFVLICRSDLNCIGLTSRSSVQNFEQLLKSIRHLEESKNGSFNYTQFYIDTILPNQEPVIIGTNDVTQETILGSGHFGKVYKGTWQRKTQDGKAVKVPVAIKTLSDGTEMSWKKEVSIFTALNQNHSSIIKFCGLLIGDEDKIQMVTEFAAFGSLLDRLRAKDITSIATLSQFSVQISSGMVFLHSKNLVHRDLSARNILVTAKNQVKISDFGLSKVVDNTNKEWVMESPESLPMRWLAPESINNGVFTASSDVWSFAVVLWEMFTFGAVPWGEQTNEQVKLKIQNGECLPEPKLCPCGLYEVMVMCFCSDAHQRPSFHNIKEELIQRQPKTYLAAARSTGRYDLNFDVGDFITSLKPLSETENNFWLGQHEDSLLFGRFDVNHTKPISYSIPYSLDAQRETEENNEDHEMLMQRFRQQTTLKVKGKDGSRVQYSDDNACYVNMSPPMQPDSPQNPPPLPPTPTAAVQEKEPHYQTPKSSVKKSPVENLKMEEIKYKSRPHSEVLSSKKEFFDLKPNSGEAGTLKSGSDSKILFKDTKPDVQNKVMDGIAKNMTAFLSLTDKKDSTETNENLEYLNPVDVSSVKPKTNLNSILMSVDPYAKSKSSSCENIYSEIDDKSLSSTNSNQFKRPRPRGTLQHHEEKDAPSAYRKSSLDAYANSVRKDFESLAERIGTKPDSVSSEHLPGVSSSMKVPVDKLQNCPAVRNTHYLTKFDSVIPLSGTSKQNEISGQSRYQVGAVSVGSTNVSSYPYAPPSSYLTTNNSNVNNRYLHVNNTQETHANPQQPSPDYYSNFLADQKPLNYFTYDPKAPAILKGSPDNLTSKEKSRQALTNYSTNNWDSFDDCVKDPKKLEKNRMKTNVTNISWPTDQKASDINKQNNKEEFSSKFQKIRSILPDATVSECLEGLRYTENDVERAIKFIQIQKLARGNYGFNSEECEKLFSDCHCDFVATENLLKTKFLKGKFQYLSEAQIRETLQVNNWNLNLTSKTIFVQQCRDFGIQESKAMSLYNECDENVTKALEMAKIIRVAEITSQAEQHCFKMLTHCKWDVERTVHHILSKGGN